MSGHVYGLLTGLRLQMSAFRQSEISAKSTNINTRLGKLWVFLNTNASQRKVF